MRYKVTVIRTAEGEIEIEVEAKNPQEAESKAIEEAKNSDISSHESRYLVSHVALAQKEEGHGDSGETGSVEGS